MDSSSPSRMGSRTATIVEEILARKSIEKDVEDVCTVSPVANALPLPSTAINCSLLRKAAFLATFCLAQFLDAFNTSALFPAIPTLGEALGMTSGQTVWIISATQLTFAAFLLVSGRISDVYNPKHAFIFGIFGLGISNLTLGFIRNKIGLFILRAVAGIFGSMTIPSALNLIVQLFPKPREQSRAISIFGAAGAIGNMLGLLLGAIFLQVASWPWIFWFAAIVCIPLSLFCCILIPGSVKPAESLEMTGIQKLALLDITGVSVLTVALVLLIFSLTTGSSTGWATSEVLVPLIASILMIAFFFYYESIIPADRAAVPPRTWAYPNFTVLLLSGLLPYFYWTTIFLVYTSLWQESYGWSALSTAIHMLPIGIAAFILSFTSSLSNLVNAKYLILAGHALMIVAGVIFPFADDVDKYFSYTMPAFFIGSTGAMLAYQNGNIAIFQATPPRIAGTVGAMFNSALQLGSAVGAAIITTIQTTVQDRQGADANAPGPAGYQSRADAFWFVLGIVVIEAFSVLVFYKPGLTPAGVHGVHVEARIPDPQTHPDTVSLGSLQTLPNSGTNLTSAECIPNEKL